MQVSVGLLAGPSFFQGDVELSRSSNRTSLFFSYLAYQADWVSRDSLLALFWPEKREAQARKNLRTLLYKSKQEPHAEHLEIEEERVRWLVKTDVAHFQEAIALADWKTAVGLYKGAFLENYKSSESFELENWLEQTRNELHASWREAVLQSSDALIKDAHYQNLTDLAFKVLRYDDLAEDIVVLAMKSQALAGKTAASLKTYEAFKQRLIAELDIEPLESTKNFAESIKENLLQDAEAKVSNLGPTQKRTASYLDSQAKSIGISVPQHLTPFIGRKLELLDLANLLKEPSYRQLTLLGPGGIGKSRLAMELLKEQAFSFKDGVAFVPLAALTSAADIADTLASILGLRLVGNTSVEDEVIDYLVMKEILIVFDNFEHLLEGTKLVKDILSKTKKTKILCTSRVILALPNELVYDVVGLTTPALGEQNLEAYDATRLFLSSARRNKLDFSFESEDYASLIELCQILEGMPLAIELASTWVRLLNISELLIELKTDKDFLEVDGQQISARHKSMRAVFETSWQLLTAEEQRVLADLSVFRGGFDRQAIKAIIKASARTLLSLVNKSLIKTDGKGRFTIHELVRQFAAEKLGHASTVLEAEHGTYYLSLLGDLLSAIRSDSPKEGLAQIEQDLENIRLAWRWALLAKAFSLCEQAVEPLSIFFISQYRLQEGLSFWLQALSDAAVKTETKLSCLIRLKLGYIYTGLDQYDAAQEQLYLGLEKAQFLKDDNAELLVTGLTSLANVKARLGMFKDAVLIAQDAYDLASQQVNQELELKSRAWLAFCFEGIGHVDEAREHYAAVLAAERLKNHPVSLLPSLGAYGRFLIELGEAEKAQALFREGLVLAETYDITGQLSFMWEGLGRASFLLGHYEEALQQSKKALAQSEAIKDLMGIAVESCDVAKALIALNRLNEAQQYLRKALKIIWKTGEIPWVMEVLFVWAKYFSETDDEAKAQQLIDLVACHESTKFLTKEKARQYLADGIVKSAIITKDYLEATINELLGFCL